MEPKLLFCPSCGLRVFKYQAVVECGGCGQRWFIINTSKRKEKL